MLVVNILPCRLQIFIIPFNASMSSWRVDARAADTASHCRRRVLRDDRPDRAVSGTRRGGTWRESRLQQVEKDALSSYTGFSSLSQGTGGHSANEASVETLNSSIVDRHSGGVLRHHFFSPSLEAAEDLSRGREDGDGQAQEKGEGERLLDIHQPKYPLYLKALEPKTKLS
jgi:hypothetical protein